MLLVIKNSPFTSSELALIKERVEKSGAKVIAMPGGYVQPPYDRLLLSVTKSNNNNQQQHHQLSFDPQSSGFFEKPPTDDSPFFFARQLVPDQMVSLMETVVGVSRPCLIVGLLFKGKQH